MKRDTIRKNTSSFVKECMDLRGNLYDYSLVDYKNNKTKVKIICKNHGVFEQTPNNHLSKKQQCPKCSDFYFEIKNQENCILDFEKIHGKKYDYSKVKYNGNKVKVEIICPNHGSFFQTPNNHLKGQHCPNCIKKSNFDFINQSNLIHNNKYIYTNTNYINDRSKVKIECFSHGIFEQRAGSHFSGIGCPKCRESKGERTIRIFLEENKIDYFYNYSFPNCLFTKPLRFDFYLPKYNTCIEFDGEQHYKSIKFFGGKTGLNKRIKRDKIKTEFCKKTNIELIRLTNKDVIKNKLYECLL
jgi:Zn finger protein HypA/HybF involved in hydrogenase expression